MMIKFDELRMPQRLALADMVARGGIDRTEDGFEGTLVHRPQTVRALAKRGLCVIRARTGVEATTLGRCVVSRALGPNIYGGAVAVIDAARTRKR